MLPAKKREDRFAKVFIRYSLFNIQYSLFDITHYVSEIASLSSIFIFYFSLRGCILLSFALMQKKQKIKASSAVQTSVISCMRRAKQGLMVRMRCLAFGEAGVLRYSFNFISLFPGLIATETDVMNFS